MLRSNYFLIIIHTHLLEMPSLSVKSAFTDVEVGASQKYFAFTFPTLIFIFQAEVSFYLGEALEEANYSSFSYKDRKGLFQSISLSVDSHHCSYYDGHLRWSRRYVLLYGWGSKEGLGTQKAAQSCIYYHHLFLFLISTYFDVFFTIIPPHPDSVLVKWGGGGGSHHTHTITQ